MIIIHTGLAFVYHGGRRVHSSPWYSLYSWSLTPLPSLPPFLPPSLPSLSAFIIISINFSTSTCTMYYHTTVMCGMHVRVHMCTVLGAIEPSELGVTLTHEHLLADSGAFMIDPKYVPQSSVADLDLKMENLGMIRQHPSTCTRSTYQSWGRTPYPWSPRLRGIIQLSRIGNVLRNIILWLILKSLQFGFRPNRLHHSLGITLCKLYAY